MWGKINSKRAFYVFCGNELMVPQGEKAIKLILGGVHMPTSKRWCVMGFIALRTAQPTQEDAGGGAGAIYAVRPHPTSSPSPFGLSNTLSYPSNPQYELPQLVHHSHTRLGWVLHQDPRQQHGHRPPVWGYWGWWRGRRGARTTGNYTWVGGIRPQHLCPPQHIQRFPNFTVTLLYPMLSYNLLHLHLINPPYSALPAHDSSTSPCSQLFYSSHSSHISLISLISSSYQFLLLTFLTHLSRNSLLAHSLVLLYDVLPLHALVLHHLSSYLIVSPHLTTWSSISLIPHLVHASHSSLVHAVVPSPFSHLFSAFVLLHSHSRLTKKVNLWHIPTNQADTKARKTRYAHSQIGMYKERK